MGPTRSCVYCLLLLFALLSGTSAQTVDNDCSMLTEAPINPVFALGGGGCVNCTLGTRSPRWEIELDGSFTTMSADSEPPDCNCVIRETRLCFQDVTAEIASSYRCQIQRPMSANLVECDFQVQLATPPMIDATVDLTKTVNRGASATLPLVLSAPGLPSPTIQWLRDTSPISITQGGRYSVDSAGSLTIANVVPEDRGTYQVRVSNIGGDDTVDYTLLVNFAEISLKYSVVNGVGEVRCEAIGWPASQDAVSHVTLTGPNTQTVIMRMPYEVTIVATQTINPAPDCLPQQTCTINVFMDELSGTLTPCPTPTPTLTLDKVDTITSSSAVAHWTYSGSEDASFTITVSGPSGTQTFTSTMRMITLTDLVPGTVYSVEVSVRDTTIITTAYMFTTTCTASFNNRILDVTASTVTLGNDRTIRLTWEESSEEDVTGYRLYVDPCVGDLPCTPLVSGRDITSYKFPVSISICDGSRYSFHVQSINECGGGGPNSSDVLQTCELLNGVELEPHTDTALTITWVYRLMPLSTTVSVQLVASPNRNQLESLTYEISSNVMRGSACIQGLESDTTYEVCLSPTFTSSTSRDEYCDYITTTTNNDQSSSNEGCLMPSTSEPTNLVVIENWHIAVIVVGGLAIVAMVFCLVGLCFACQSSKQKDDFGSNSSLNDPTYNSSSINGVSMHTRSVSPPSRSCLSYHTKGHSTNWSDHVDTLRQMETDTGTHV